MPNILGLIDLQYLLYELKKRELKLNLPSLRDFLTNPEEGRYGVAFFVYVPSSFKDLNYLRINGFQVISGPQIGSESIDKHIDTHLVLDALEIIDLAPIDIVVIVSGDADFVTLCEALRKREISVEVGSFPEVSTRLKQAASRFIDLSIWARTINDINTISPKQPYISPTHFASKSSKNSTHARPVQDHGKMSIPSFVFYKKGDFWLIGDKGNEMTIEHSKGLSFIYFLLEHPSQSFSSEVVYNLAKQVESEYIRPQDELKKDDLLVGASAYEILGDKTPGEIYNAINSLKEKIRSGDYSNEQDFTKKLDQIHFLEDYLKKGYFKGKKAIIRNHDEEKVRINVTKNIRRAILKIHQEVPSLKPFLNTSTIKIYKYQWSYEL